MNEKQTFERLRRIPYADMKHIFRSVETSLNDMAVDERFHLFHQYGWAMMDFYSEAFEDPQFKTY